jgi:hypothetical protein
VFLAAQALSPDAYLEAGRLFQHSWLLATQHSLAFQPLAGMPLLLRQHRRNAPALAMLHPKDRQRIAQCDQRLSAVHPALAQGYPLIAFRLGEAPPPSYRSPRRPIESLLEAEAA